MKIYFLLILLVVFIAVTNWMVLSEDNVPFCYDEAGNCEVTTILYTNLLRDFDFKDFLTYYYYTSSFSPHLYMIFQLPIVFLFGNTQDIMVMVNIVFLTILIFSAYRMGKELKDEKTGLLSSFFIATMPVIFGFSRTNFPIIALTAWVTLGIYLLLKSNKFRDRKHSLLFGIIFSLGLLTKLTYPIYMFGPLVTYLIIGEKRLRKQQILNMLLSFFLFFGTFFILWFGPNLITGKFFKTEETMYLKEFIIGNFFCFWDTFFYLEILKKQLNIVYFIFLIIAIVLFIFSKFRKKYIFLSWIIVPMTFFSLYWYKDSRYLVPVFPAYAFIISFSFSYIKNIKLRNIFYFSIIIFSIFYVLITSFLYIENGFSEEKYNNQRIQTGLIHSYKVDWPTDEVLKYLNNYKLVYNYNKKLAEVIIIGEGPFIDYFEQYVTLQRNELGRQNEYPYKLVTTLISPGSVWDSKIKLKYKDYIIFQHNILELVKLEFEEEIKEQPRRANYIRNLLILFKKLIRKFNIEKHRYKLLDIVKVGEKKFSIYVNKVTLERIKSLQ